MGNSISDIDTGLGHQVESLIKRKSYVIESDRQDQLAAGHGSHKIRHSTCPELTFAERWDGQWAQKS